LKILQDPLDEWENNLNIMFKKNNGIEKMDGIEQIDETKNAENLLDTALI